MYLILHFVGLLWFYTFLTKNPPKKACLSKALFFAFVSEVTASNIYQIDEDKPVEPELVTVSELEQNLISSICAKVPDGIKTNSNSKSFLF